MPSTTPSENFLTHILSRLTTLFRVQKETHEIILRNGEGIDALQCLVDLFRHPEVSLSDLAQMLEGTLTEVERSARSMTQAIRSNEERVTILLNAIKQIQDRQEETLILQKSLEDRISALSRHLGFDSMPVGRDV